MAAIIGGAWAQKRSGDNPGPLRRLFCRDPSPRLHPARQRASCQSRGHFDEHLRTIESAFDVKIQRRNESFRVEGAKGRAERAVVLLQQLYGRAARPIGAEESSSRSSRR
jgi:Phosphate starvation-inducible protein PhoH, predicted ATPase